MVTNCVKTIPLSQSQGQQILLSLHPVLEEVRRYEAALDVAGLMERALQGVERVTIA